MINKTALSISICLIAIIIAGAISLNLFSKKTQENKNELKLQKGDQGEFEKSENESSEAQGEPEIIEVKEFKITARRWEFEPSQIQVSQGDMVRLSISSEDVIHGFSLSEFQVSGNIEPGKTTEIEFIADKRGTFNFYCNVYCGSGHSGMKGTLVVN